MASIISVNHAYLRDFGIGLPALLCIEFPTTGVAKIHPDDSLPFSFLFFSVFFFSV